MALVKELLAVHAALFALISHGEAILGGRDVDPPHSRPYMASIQVPQGETMRHECGGFLVAPQWVMTAAHCQPDTTRGMKVVLGAHSLSQPEETKQTFDILQAHSHPQYNPTNYAKYDNDIALIKLDRPVTVTEAVRDVKYLRAGGAADRNPATGATVETAGWGSVNNLEERPDRLKELNVTVVDRRFCGRDDYYGARFTSNMMCAHNRRPTEDSCDGDSGGPLLYNGMAVGLTSNGGAKCGQAKKPGVYTVISKYTDWIDSTLAL